MKNIPKISILVLSLAAALTGCGSSASPDSSSQPAHGKYQYTLSSVQAVIGRQGICTDGDQYWVSDSTKLARYDKDWKVQAENREPFTDFELEVNHIGDIDIYNGEIYAGVEYFVDGQGKNIQVAVYDASTLDFKRVFPFSEETGQMECCGIAVDPDSKTVYMASWIDDESSTFLYMYDLESGDFKGKLAMDPAPSWIQGVAYYDGDLYVTCDDGDADQSEPDHMYRIKVNGDWTQGSVVLERTFDDVTMQGEIEGLSFDAARGQFLLLYNRGARIVQGMPKGFYEGYTEEIHEVFLYDISSRK